MLNMKHLSLLLFVFNVSNANLFAQNISLDWVGVFNGSNSNNHITAFDINSNNEIVSTGFFAATPGNFSATVDFNPGPAVNNLSAPPTGQVTYVCKLDSNRNYLWAQRFAGPNGWFWVNDIKYDAIGNVIICGNLSGTLDFDNSTSVYNLTSTQPNSGLIDAVIVKLDPNGNFIWAKQIGSSYDDSAIRLNTDSSLNIYTLGTFYGVVDFDPNTGTEYQTGNGGASFVLKLDASGNFIFVSTISTWSPSDFKMTSVGEIIITGLFTGTVDFDSGPNIYNASSSTYLDSWGNPVYLQNMFVLKLDSIGQFDWVKVIQSSSVFSGFFHSKLSIDQYDNIYSVFLATGSIDVDPGVSVFSLNATPPQNCLFKLNSDGMLTDAVLIPSENDCRIAINDQNELFVSGNYGNAITQPEFSFGIDTLTLNSVDAYDNFLIKMDDNLNNLWVKSFGGVGNQQVSILGIDNSSNLIMSSNLVGTMDFDPSSEVHLESSPASNTYIAKYKPCTNTQSSISVISCDDFTLNGTVYSTSGTYYNITQNASGCDSIITLSLVITNSNTTNYISAIGCGSYILNGQTYDSTGIYTQTLQNSVGCDSIITLDLVISSTTNVPTPEICMVSADNQGLYNVVYWDKTLYFGVDSFLIYREVQNNNYSIIGVVPNDSLSLFIDTVRTLYFPNTGDPRVSSYRYKIAIKDVCGNIGLKSPYHRTIFLQDQQNGNFNWNHYEIQSATLPIPQLINYLLQRDDNQDGVFDITVGSTTGITATDPDYSSLVQLGSIWRIETDWNIECNPTKQNNLGKSLEITSRSNKKNDQSLGLEVNNPTQTKFNFHPNSVNENLYVSCSDPSALCKVDLLDLNGKIVLSSMFYGESTIDVRNLSVGSYLIKFNIPGFQENHLLLKN